MNGWLILDKPLGLSSAQGVGKTKRFVKPSKIGHAGTLDPLASGILPLAVGEATKTVQFAMDSSKSYRFTVRWGEARATDDAEGEITATSAVRPSKTDIEAILPRFTGSILQVPPVYSAVHIGGVRAYALARAGVEMELAAREIRVDALELVEITDADHAIFEVACGKGLYVRSLARDMALGLGTVGHVATLRRTRVGKFSEKDAISLDNLEETGNKGLLATLLRPVESVLDDIPAWEIDSALAHRVRCGQKLIVPKDLAVQAGGLVRVRSADALIAVGRIEKGLMIPERVFNLSD